MHMRKALISAFLAASILPFASRAQVVGSTDLAAVSPADGVYRRVLGSVGNGSSGVPVAGGFDMDKDQTNDYAFAAMRASPQGRDNAGIVFLIFGDDTAVGTIDTADPDPRVLEIHGDQVKENTGSEIWMADVTGDGFGDLIICRQNYSPGGTRTGAGALTLIPASPALRTMAANSEILDLRSPPETLEIVTIHGAMNTSRFCIWARNGDVTGDGTDDFVVGADREASDAINDAGAIYIFRGGNYLETSQTIDLANFGSVSAGNIARVRPRAISGDTSTLDYHFGATVQMADLDGNNRTEVLAAATLNRAGASLSPEGGSGNGSGGTNEGTLFIAWDDNFSGTWMPAPDFVIDAGPGSFTVIDGGSDNDNFGEEILGGLDFDDNGTADLFIGDLTSDGYGSVSRSNTGLAQVIYDAGTLKNLEFDLEPDEIGEAGPPNGFLMATFIGPVVSALTGDTAMQGDFNSDGIADVAFSSPKDNPTGRTNAGTLHLLLGKTGPWPTVSDLEPSSFPDSADVQIHEIYGANIGDILCYSGASGDLTNDGRIDLIINEMLGDGSSEPNVGNLLIIDSRVLFKGQLINTDGFEDP